MAFVWSTWGFVAALAMPLAVVLAAFVYRSGPDRPLNQRLAFLLLVEGMLFGVNSGFTYMTDHAAAARAWRVAGAVAVPWIVIAYARFLALLDSPASRFLASRWFLGVVLASSAAFIVLVMTGTGYSIEMVASPFGPWEAKWVGPVAQIGFASIVLTSIAGLLVAVSAFRRATPHSSQRRQAAWFLAAFGVRDAVLVTVMTFWVLDASGIPLFRINTWDIPVMAIAPLLELMLLTYGILRFQMFDIELRIKSTLARTAMAGLLLGVFFVVAVTAENYLTDRYGWAIGGVAAGLMMFAINPLQRFGERVANAAMPHVHDTPEYRARRTRDVYQAAYEGMLADGRITEKEKDVLASLAQDLGLGPVDVRAIEKATA